MCLKSYAEQAQAINKPTAVRAVANANGANKIDLVNYLRWDGAGIGDDGVFFRL